MPPSDPYNDLVRAHFANPGHAGDLEDDYTRVVRARASLADGGSRVELAAGVRDGILESVRYRVFGCPHLIALCEAVCADLEGQQHASLRLPDAGEQARRLETPVEKTGLVLLLEDVLASLGEALRGQKGKD